MSARLSVVKEGTQREAARTGVAQIRLVAAGLIANFFGGLVGTLKGSILLDVALRGVSAQIRGHFEGRKGRSC